MALNIEQRLGQKLTNEQLILWNYLLQRWPNLTFQAFYFIGNSAISEMTIYSANKLYVCYEITFPSQAGAAVATPNVVFYDEGNVNFYGGKNTETYWDVAAPGARTMPNVINFNNLYFSRFATTVYGFCRFIGYRINF